VDATQLSDEDDEEYESNSNEVTLHIAPFLERIQKGRVFHEILGQHGI